GLIIGNLMTPMVLVTLFTIALESSIPGVNEIKKEESNVIVVVEENRQDIEAPPAAAADAVLPLNPDRVTRIFLEQLRNQELAAATDFMLIDTVGLAMSMAYWLNENIMTTASDDLMDLGIVNILDG
ncbi:1817_t:CDS:2, partial [Racocetra fulgida]